MNQSRPDVLRRPHPRHPSSSVSAPQAESTIYSSSSSPNSNFMGCTTAKSASVSCLMDDAGVRTRRRFAHRDPLGVTTPDARLLIPDPVSLGASPAPQPANESEPPKRSPRTAASKASRSSMLGVAGASRPRCDASLRGVRSHCGGGAALGDEPAMDIALAILTAVWGSAGKQRSGRESGPPELDLPSGCRLFSRVCSPRVLLVCFGPIATLLGVPAMQSTNLSHAWRTMCLPPPACANNFGVLGT